MNKVFRCQQPNLIACLYSTERLRKESLIARHAIILSKKRNATFHLIFFFGLKLLISTIIIYGPIAIIIFTQWDFDNTHLYLHS